MQSRKLRRSLLHAAISVMALLAVAVSTTLAWYIFTVNAHTTRLHMAAGTNVTLQISGTRDGVYSSSAKLERFQGLLNPVSTDRIQNGFQKVAGFTRASGSAPLLANLFSKSLEMEKDYYKTSLFFRAKEARLDVYLAEVGFTDSDEARPISSAIRIGFVVPATGQEFIFAISEKKNPEKEYNTATGWEGCVLDSTRSDGSTVEFTPLNGENYCNYDGSTGVVSLKPGSQAICTVDGSGGGESEPVQVDVYIWLEGCDEDCTRNLCATTLEDLALSFAGYAG